MLPFRHLVSHGAVCENFFVTTSLCSPSRASFLTGCYAHTHGVIGNDGVDPDWSATPSFAQRLRAAGYDTGFVGKIHMQSLSGPAQVRPGFDYWLGFRGQGDYRDNVLNENGREFRREGYVTDVLTEYSLKFLRRERAGPFALCLWHKAIHADFVPADRHANAFADAELPLPPHGNHADDYAGKPAWQRRPPLPTLLPLDTWDG